MWNPTVKLRPPAGAILEMLPVELVSQVLESES